MAKILKAIYRIMCDTALVFTAVMLIFGVFIMSDDRTFIIAREVVLSFFYFSFMVGVASVFFLIKKLPITVSAIIHFLVSSVGYVWHILTVTERSTAQMFVGAALFVVIYWGVFAISKFIQIPIKKSESKIDATDKKKEKEEDIKVLDEDKENA